MKIIDANVILRYLLNDVEEMTEEATEIIENSTVQVLNEVLAEVVYVLEGVYELDRDKLAEVLLRFIELDNVVIEDKLVMIDALNKYREIKLDFVDCLLYAYSKNEKIEVFTFDKKLNKEIESEAG